MNFSAKAPLRVPDATDGIQVETRKRTRLDRARRREQLLRCAVATMAESGIARGVHADVARRADVAISTVFDYFKTREILVESVLTHVEGRLLPDRIISADFDSLLAPEKIIWIVTKVVDMVRSDPDIIRVWLDWSTSVRADVWPKYIRFQENVVKQFAKLIREGRAEGSVSKDIVIKEAARIIVGQSHMLATMTLADTPEREVRRHLRYYVNMALGREPS